MISELLGDFAPFSSIYINKKSISGLKEYKYSSIDDSPLSNAFLKPFWTKLDSYIPDYIHPNILTLVGFLGIFINFLIALTLKPNNDTTTNLKIQLETGKFLFMALMAAVSHHCDGVDGPHARRLKLSSPIGEMLDHGVDSWSLGIIFLTLNQISDFKHFFYLNSMILLSFFIIHWEKQFTGVMYLPWSYDVAMLALFVYYLILGLFPDLVYFLHQPEIFFYIEWILIAIVSSQILSSLFQGLMRMYRSYKQTYNHYSNRKVFIICLNLLPILLTIALFTRWAQVSPNNISVNYSNLFNWCFMTLSSHLICHSIIASMTNEPLQTCQKKLDLHFSHESTCELIKLHSWDSLMTPVLVSLLSVTTLKYMNLNVKSEIHILCLLFLTITATHISFSVCVIKQLCKELKKSFFVVQKPTAKIL